MHLKKRILIIALSIFILTSAMAIADSNEKNLNHEKKANPIASINFSDRVVYVLDHANDPVNGNWIIMKSPHKEKRIQLPHPIKFTYSGPTSKEYKGVSGTMYMDEDGNYKVTYPSTPLYLTHPIYLPYENVSMSFYGERALKGEVEIYLFNSTLKTGRGILDAFNANDIKSLDKLFSKSADGRYKKYTATLGKNGDLLDYDFGPFDAGQYCIVMVQKNNDNSLTVLSTTAFVVAKYDISVSAPNHITKEKNLDISMNLENAPDQNNYTYGAVLIKKQAYRADIKINSDGTRNGTNVIVNDIDVIDEFGINSSNYRSKFTRGELQTEIQTLIGEGNGALAIGEKGENTLSLTTFDLPVGNYYLFVGAYERGKGLVGLTQLLVDIKPKGISIKDNPENGNNENSGNVNNDNSENGNNGNSGNGNEEVTSSEPAKNIKAKEFCYQYISKGKKICYGFVQKVTSIDYVKFDSKKDGGKVIAIVEKLKEKSSLTNSKPKGEVYENVNIWIGNGKFANSQNIGNATVGFRVNNAWITENHINPDSIVLQHFSDNKWTPLPTKEIKRDEKCIYFEAKTPGFSPFAITAEKNIITINKKPEIPKPSELKPQNIDKIAAFSESLAQQSINSIFSKIASFFIGFLGIALLGGFIIMEKK
jgi:methanogen extracellular protein (TIGR04279 family)/PGF-pre-PGF domain-containing protein